MIEVGAIHQIEFAVPLFALVILSLLEERQAFGALFLDDKSDPMVDYTSENHEDGGRFECHKLFDLIIEYNYLVDGSVHKTKTVVHYIEEYPRFAFGWPLEFKHFWFVIDQII